MIDRSPNRLHFCLRPGTLRVAFYVSCGLFLAVPVAGLACIAGGVLAFAGCMFALSVLIIGGTVLAIGGVGMVLFGLLGEQHELTGGGILAGIVGLAAVGFFQIHNQQVLSAAETALSTCWLTAGRLVKNLFLGQWVFLWAWSVVAVAIISAAIVLLLIAVLRSESFFKSCFCGIHYTCPRGHERGTPLFRCPQCSTPIRGLLPSRYGIFAAQCGRCQAKLPTLDWSGRADLHKVCGTCAADLVHPAIGNAREIHWAIVGSESSGKTTLLYASLWQLARNYGPKYGFELDFGSAQGRRTVEGSMQRLASGLRLAKTHFVPRPPALNAAIRSGELDKCLLYLYDAAGEDFTNESRMSGHGFHRFLDGVVLVIDPFTEVLSRPQGASLDRGVWSEVQPAVTDAAAVFQPFLNRLEEMMGISAEGVFPIPVAVVVTKTACFPRRMLRARREYPAGARRSVRDFMLDLGLANLIAGLESRFRKVGYFATSAAEEVSARSKGSRRLKAALPLLWLLGESGTLPRKLLRRKQPQAKFSRTKFGFQSSLKEPRTILAGNRDGETVPAPFSAEGLGPLGSTAP